MSACRCQHRQRRQHCSSMHAHPVRSFSAPSAYFEPPGDPPAGLALTGSTHVLLALGLVLLLARQWAFFVRHREALITSVIMHMTWTGIPLGDRRTSSTSRKG